MGIFKVSLGFQMHIVTIYDIIKMQCSSLTKCNLFIETSVWLRSIFVTSKDKVRMDMLFPIVAMLLNDAIQSNTKQKSHVISLLLTFSMCVNASLCNIIDAPLLYYIVSRQEAFCVY